MERAAAHERKKALKKALTEDADADALRGPHAQRTSHIRVAGDLSLKESRGGQAATRSDRGFIAPAVRPAVAGARVGPGSRKEYTAESQLPHIHGMQPTHHSCNWRMNVHSMIDHKSSTHRL